VAETTVEAVADGQGRLYALWLRTPEPVDWRRVRLSLHVWHLVGSGSCATRYAHRKPLKLSVEALPGPDASSAFLVGSLADIRTRLPRGEYTLTLSFHPQESGLPRLEKSVAVGGTPEVVNLKFVHFDGPNWPLPSQDVSLPAGAAEALVSLLDLPPQAIAELLAADTGSAAARQALVARLKGAGRAAPRPVGSGGRLRRPKTV
jgi:hypothetical protein